MEKEGFEQRNTHFFSGELPKTSPEEKKIINLELQPVQPFRIGLTYDDVLLVPKCSSINSRRDVDTRTRLSRTLTLNIPIISANMDTVTEAAMAIALAREGGIGIIHRFLPLEQQVAQVHKVKRSEGIIIEKPYTLQPAQPLSEAKTLMDDHSVTGLPVVDAYGKIVGMLTNRDLLFEDNLHRPVGEVMTQQHDLIIAPIGTSIEKAKELLHQYRIEKLPLVDDRGFLQGLITSSDIVKRSKYPSASKDRKGHLLVGAAVGVKADFLDRAGALLNAGCDVLVIDIAHGHSEHVIRTIKALRNTFGDVELIAGNVATAAGAEDLISAGVDAVKVGVGGGCFAAGTRILMANAVYKNIEDIQPGDRVINKEGKPVTVRKSFCTGVKKVCRIRNSIFYDDTYVTPDHRYWVGDLNTSSNMTLQSRGYAVLLQVQSKTIPKASKYKWKEVKDLQQDTLLMPRSINFELSDTFEIVLKKCCGGNWRTGFVYKIDVILKPNYQLGYIFGLFLGDGSACTALYKKSRRGSVRWYLNRTEKYIANKLAQCITTVFNKKCSIKEKTNIIQVILYYKPLADFLQNFGKKKNKELPSNYLVNNKEYLQGLLDGLIDSDGHKEENGRIRFYNTSKKLIELFSIANYLLTGVLTNGGKRKISIGTLKNITAENCSISYTAEIINTGHKRLTEQYQVAKLLDKEETDFYVSVYDLEIDCSTHSFIANNAIVHNSICITRIVTGSGVPQLTAVMDCAKIGERYDIPIIADGGIKQAGDITKSLAAGASTVMLGNLLAGTEESPGQTVIRGGRKFKIYRGMAGFGATLSKKEREKEDSDLQDVVPEGVEGMLPYRGSVSEVIKQLLGGLRSGMSYCGTRTLYELRKHAHFIRVTPAGVKESHPHDIDQLK